MTVDDIASHLLAAPQDRGVVADVGCSMNFQLRYGASRRTAG
jgi:hypothetical protein